MTLPDGERLLITIDRECEVECDYEALVTIAEPPTDPENDGWVAKVINACVGGILDDGCQRLGKCPTCHGTGRIKRRIRGWCEVEIEAIHQRDSTPHHFVNIGTVPNRYNIGGCKDVPSACEAIRESVVAALLDGTLPDEIAKNIEITDIEEANNEPK